MSPRLGPAMAAVSVALIALGVDVQATTCIVVATTRQIVIATDGLQVSTDGRRSSVCKIGGSSTLGYTLAGLAGANTGFDAQRMAQQIATTHTSALSAMAAFRDQVAPEIARIVTAAKASSAGGRADYQRWTELHVPVIQAFFGSLTNGHTEAEVCTFLLDVSGDLRCPREQYNGVNREPGCCQLVLDWVHSRAAGGLEPIAGPRSDRVHISDPAAEATDWHRVTRQAQRCWAADRDRGD